MARIDLGVMKTCERVGEFTKWNPQVMMIGCPGRGGELYSQESVKIKNLTGTHPGAYTPTLMHTD